MEKGFRPVAQNLLSIQSTGMPEWILLFLLDSAQLLDLRISARAANTYRQN